MPIGPASITTRSVIHGCSAAYIGQNVRSKARSPQRAARSVPDPSGDGGSGTRGLATVSRPWLEQAELGHAHYHGARDHDVIEHGDPEQAADLRQAFGEQDVDAFEVSLDGRWLLWWPRGEYDPDPSRCTHACGTGARAKRSSSAPTWTCLGVHLAPGGVAASAVHPIATEITFLDTLARVKLVDAYTVRTVGADGTLLLQAGNLPGYGELHTLAPHESSPILRGRRGVQERYVWADDEAFWAGEQTDGSAPGITTPPEPGVQANVVRIPYDTATAEVVAPDLWEPVSLSGGHWVGARDFSGDAVDAVWLRTDAGTEMLVDDDVFARINRVQPVAVLRGVADVSGSTRRSLGLRGAGRVGRAPRAVAGADRVAVGT
jgi:hypothetical protein